MKNVILDLAVTLDGFIEGPQGEIDWCILDEDMDFSGFLSSIDTIFYGRVSYDAWGNYQPDPDSSEQERNLWKSVHSKRKVVFSTQNRPESPDEWISADLASRVRELKKEDGKDIWLYGGASLIRSFIELKLIDLYRLSVHPIVLGKGKPLFENLQSRLNLDLVATHVFKSGVVQLIYQTKAEE